MDSKRIDATKLALLDLFESKPNKAVMQYELQLRLPEGVTDEEVVAAVNQLEEQHFVTFSDGNGNAYRNAFIRGAAYQAWKAQVQNLQNNIFNVSGNTFDGPTQFGTGNTLNVQINESDSRQLIALIEMLVQNPAAKEKATPILEQLKSGAIETAKEGLKLLLASVLGGGA
ncbi:hypothetical protein [Nevskia ramosa]|uniref:hypothetical protein n=1 Tax=Nevskia ramosa TaxID=64002 RepID=UPI003D0DCF67